MIDNTVEIRVYVISVDSDFDFKYHYNNGDYASIIDEAEKNGDVYSLDGFQMAVNNDELFLDNSFIYIGGTK